MGEGFSAYFWACASSGLCPSPAGPDAFRAAGMADRAPGRSAAHPEVGRKKRGRKDRGGAQWGSGKCQEHALQGPLLSE